MTGASGRSFTIIVPGRLAVMNRPGMYTSLGEDLAFLHGERVGAIVSLTTMPLDIEAVRRAELEYLHEPVPDFTAPGPEQLGRIIEFIARQSEELERLVLVHCGAGLGRSGTVAAAYLVRGGLEPGAAIERVRKLRPFSVETAEQESAVEAYARRLRGDR